MSLAVEVQSPNHGAILEFPDTLDILDRIILCSGASVVGEGGVLCIARCLVASLISTQLALDASSTRLSQLW